MTSTKKKGGLGAESYFENIPTLEPVGETQPLSKTDATKEQEDNAPVSAVQMEDDREATKGMSDVKTTTVEVDDGITDSEDPDVPQARQKIRRTYALYEETQIALEEMKLAARKQGVKTTLGDLLEEAVHLLMEKRGMVSQDTTSH